MARQKLIVGTYGEINCKQLPSGAWQARARYCDVDGVVREYRKSGETKAKAKSNLKAFFTKHTGTFGDGLIQPDDTVAHLLDVWFETAEKEADERPRELAGRAPNRETLAAYRYHLRWVLERDKNEFPIGAYEIRHMRPVIIQRALDNSGVSADMRKRIRNVLVRAFDLSVFHEAINGNPAASVPTVVVPRRKKKPIPEEDLAVVRAVIREWAMAERRQGPVSKDLPDIVELLIATGMRIGEVVALRWADVHLSPDGESDLPALGAGQWVPWLMVTGQVNSHGKRVDWAKTHTSIRPIALPEWAAQLLRRRKLAEEPNDLDAVFITRNGTWHYPGNVQTRLWKIRNLDAYKDIPQLQGVTPHAFRRTVATVVDEVYDAEAAKQVLGHASTFVTERHYIDRKMKVNDYRAATERLAPDPAREADAESDE